MGINKATLKDIKNLNGSRVLIRADYNVPTDSSGNIVDDKRIVESLQTLKYCLKKHAKLILCSHFGRPESPSDKKCSLEPVAIRLRQLLPNVKIFFANDCVGVEVEKQVSNLKNGEILLLENTRYHKEESANDDEFAKQLSKLGDIFVNDAFGAAHRAHASTAGVAKYLPSVAGFLMEKEIMYLSKIIKNPKRPFTVIIGGKKVEDKLPIVEKLVNIADNILLAGKLAAQWTLDTSNCKAKVDVAENVGFDIQSSTIEKWRPVIESSKTIFWNGPVGMFEDPKYAVGTKAIAEIVSKSKAVSVVGGGDTASAVVGYKFTHVSTGGGASLEFIEGKELPGIICLQDKGEKNA